MNKLREVVGVIIATLILGLIATKASAESCVLTSYLPTPGGIFMNLTTTTNTFLARDGGSVAIGTDTAHAKLDVNGDTIIRGNLSITGGNISAAGLNVSGGITANPGGVQLGNAQTCGATANSGTLRWNGSAVQVCDGAHWTSVAAPPTPICAGFYTLYGSGCQRANPCIAPTTGNNNGCGCNPACTAYNLHNTDDQHTYYCFCP